MSIFHIRVLLFVLCIYIILLNTHKHFFFFFIITRLPIGSIQNSLTNVYKLFRQKQFRYLYKNRANLDLLNLISYIIIVCGGSNQQPALGDYHFSADRSGETEMLVERAVDMVRGEDTSSKKVPRRLEFDLCMYSDSE